MTCRVFIFGSICFGLCENYRCTFAEIFFILPPPPPLLPRHISASRRLQIQSVQPHGTRKPKKEKTPQIPHISHKKLISNFKYSPPPRPPLAGMPPRTLGTGDRRGQRKSSLPPPQPLLSLRLPPRNQEAWKKIQRII